MFDIESSKCQKTLNNGIKMPCLGLGVYLIENMNSTKIFQEAIKIGYRLFDTATLYGNERQLGEAVNSSGIPREEFFITTKLWNSDQRGEKRVLEAFNNSLKLLDLDYIDLYLIHWPVPNQRIKSWKALEQIYDSGKAKAIGVSNYMIHHLKELFEQSSYVPAVNQVEMHPFHYRKDLVEFCKKKDIQIEAYSPLTKGNLLHDPELDYFNSKYNRTPAQILIRWSLQHGAVVIPKASKTKHLEDNYNIFDFNLSPTDMQKLDSLNREVVVSWDPTNVP